MTIPQENPGDPPAEKVNIDPDEKIGSDPGDRPGEVGGANLQPSTPPPLPRTPERVDRPRADSPPKTQIRRLFKSVGIGLPRNKYRIFIGKGAIPPVAESKQFVAPLAEINKVRIRVLEGDDERADHNEFLGEVGINNIRLREDGKAELEIEFSLSATGVLTIRLTDRIGETEGMARYVLPQFRKEIHGETDISNLPVEELSRKIDLLEQQMQLLRGELDGRGERQ